MRCVAAITIFLLAGACQPPTVKPTPGDVMPDFSLVDLNPASATSQQQVTPRQMLGHVSGWYFAHSS